MAPERLEVFSSLERRARRRLAQDDRRAFSAIRGARDGAAVHALYAFHRVEFSRSVVFHLPDLARAEKHFGDAELVRLLRHAESFEDGAAETLGVVAVRSGRRRREEKSEPLGERARVVSRRVSLSADANHLEDAAASKLAQDVALLKRGGHQRAVGLDASHKMRRTLVQFRHQRRQLTFKPRADGLATRLGARAQSSGSGDVPVARLGHGGGERGHRGLGRFGERREKVLVQRVSILVEKPGGVVVDLAGVVLHVEHELVALVPGVSRVGSELGGHLLRESGVGGFGKRALLVEE